MIGDTKNLDMQSIQSPEGSENHPEIKTKIPPPTETVASLDSKILATDNKVAGYERGIEETSARLTEARAKLDLPPDTEEAPSITQSRREVEKLEAQKVEFEERKTKLGGETYFAVKGTPEETPTRMEDEQDYKMILDRIENNPDAYKFNADHPMDYPRIYAERARASFARQFPDRARVYEEAEILKLERDREKSKNTQVLEQERTEQPEVAQTLPSESQAPAEPIARDTTSALGHEPSSIQWDPKDEAFEKRSAQFRTEKARADVNREQTDEAFRKISTNILKQAEVGSIPPAEPGVSVDKKENWATESKIVQAKLIEKMREQFASASAEQFKFTLDEYMAETKRFNERMAEARSSTPKYKKPEEPVLANTDEGNLARVSPTSTNLNEKNPLVSGSKQPSHINNELEQQPQIENVTKENFERNRQQGKALMANGQIWTIDEARPDGSVFLRRDITIPEALKLAEKANAGQLDRGFNIPQLNTQGVKVKGGMTTIRDLESGAKWIQKELPDSQQDATTQREAEEVRILQARIASGEFKDNNNGALDLLKDVLNKYLDRLQK